MSKHKPASLRRKNKLKQKRKACRARKRSVTGKWYVGVNRRAAYRWVCAPDPISTLAPDDGK